MRRLRTVTLGLALLAPALLPAFVGVGNGAAVACAAEAAGEAHAALVVDTGSQTTTYCVALGAGTVSGLRLIQLASAQYGLSYHLGFGGQAVCQLQGVGPSGGDCFGDYPDYWGYWHGADGGWSWAGSGAASASVSDGDVEGWSWGPGDTGSTHPSPPDLGFDDVCDTPKPSASPPARPSPSAVPSPGAGSTAQSGSQASPDAAGPTPAGGVTSRSPVPKQPKQSPAADRTPTDPPSTGAIVRAVATSGGATPSGGPPMGAFAAAAAVAVLTAGGARTLRKRRKGESA